MFSKEEAKEMRLEFWKKLENRTRRLPGQKGRRKKWIGDRTEIKGLDLRFDVDREKAIVALEINHRQENKRLEMYERLETARTLFEKAFGRPLIWDYLYEKPNGKQVCRVYVEMKADMYRKEQWSDIFYFLIDNMIRMEKAFLEVKDYLKYR
ncbi:MAG: DUF4268 domain-containing protein [Chlorobi bacterium]|nr:DUF4268 domain-containing protein [Chlorobiota bacterium]